MDRPSPIFVGVDIETTGLTADHAIIELGLAVKVEGLITGPCVTFDTLVRPTHSFQVDPGAMAVNRIDMNEVFRPSTSDTATVEASAVNWLNSWLGEPDGDRVLVPVGFNVGSFDLVFLKDHMPVLADMFSHRCLELNSAILAKVGFDHGRLADAKKGSTTWLETVRAPNGLPKREPHRAGSDALDALLLVDYMNTVMETF